MGGDGSITKIFTKAKEKKHMSLAIKSIKKFWRKTFGLVHWKV